MATSDGARLVPAEPETPIAGMDKKGEVLVNVASRPGYTPEYANYFPRGSGTTRIMQYFSQFMPPGERNTRERILRLVRNFFVPDATLRIQLFNSVTQLEKTFDFPYSGVPYFVDMCGRNQFQSMRAHFGETDEHRCDPTMPPPPTPPSFKTRVPEPVVANNTTHVVESQQMMQLSSMVNGWQVQRIGMLRALLSPYTTVETVAAPPGVPCNPDGTIYQLETRLRLQFLCFSTLAQVMYIPSNNMRWGINTITIPKEVIEDIIQYGCRREKRRLKDSEHDSSRGDEHESAEREEERQHKRARTEQLPPQPDSAGTPAGEQTPTFTIPALNGPPVQLNHWMTSDELLHLLDVCISAHPGRSQCASPTRSDGHPNPRGARTSRSPAHVS